MCHPKCSKNITSQESLIPEDLPEITDTPSHNKPNIDGYIITTEGEEVIYFTSDEAYDVWMNTKEIYSQN